MSTNKLSCDHSPPKVGLAGNGFCSISPVQFLVKIDFVVLFRMEIKLTLLLVMKILTANSQSCPRKFMRGKKGYMIYIKLWMTQSILYLNKLF